MHFHVAKAFFVSILLFCFANAAQSQTITFDVGDPVEENGYVENGMAISATAATTSPQIKRIRDWQTTDFNFGTNFGERELSGNNPAIPQYQGDIYIFSLLSGKDFNLLSLDVENPAGSGALWSMLGSAEIIGSNGQKVTLGATDLGTHYFGNKFIGISEFKIQFLPVSQVTFDNIRFAIPEPSSWLLLGLSFFGVGSIRRSRLPLISNS